MKLRSLAGILAALGFGSAALSAQSLGVWSGLGPNGNWSNALNWNGDILPANNTTSTTTFGLTTTFAATLDTNFTIGSMQISALAGGFSLGSTGGSILTVNSSVMDFSPLPVSWSPGMAGAFSLDVEGGGSFTILSTTNAGFTGFYNVTSGILIDGAANAYSPNAVMEVANPGVVEVNFNEAIGALSDTGGGNGSVVLAPNATLSITGPFTTTFSGIISGNGAVAFSGTQLTLTNDGTYTGGTTVSAGTLVGTSVNSFGTGPVNLTNTATLQISAVNPPNSAATVAIGPLTGSVLTTLNLAEGTLEIDGASNFQGTIVGPGSLNFANRGILALTGSSPAFSGGIDLQSGTLELATAASGGTGTLILGNSDNQATLDSLSSTLALSNNLLLENGAQIGTGKNAAITLNGSIEGSGAVTYNGGPSGTLTLNGADTGLTGFTLSSGTVIAGGNAAFGSISNPVTLAAGSTLSVTSPVTVGNALTFNGPGASTLTGNGTFSAPLVANARVSIVPGNPLGVLSFSGGIVFTTGSALTLNVADAGSNAGNGWGTLSGSNLAFNASPGGIVLNLNSINSAGQSANTANFNASAPFAWIFATSTAPITGNNLAGQFNLNASGFTNALNGGTFSVSETSNDLSLEVNFTPVPEPCTWVLLASGAGVAGLSALYRRRAARTNLPRT